MRNVRWLRVSLFFCGIIFIGSLTTSYAQTVYYKHFTVKDGLAGNHVYMCHQDIDGYMWVATTSGLSRFDGKQFKNYDYEDGLPDNEVLFVTNDDGNRIWVNSFSAQNAISILETKLHSTNVQPVKSGVIEVPTLSEEYYSHKNKTTYLSGRGVLVIIKQNKQHNLLRVPFVSNSPVFEAEDGSCYTGDGVNLYRIVDTTIRYVQTLNRFQPYFRVCYYNKVLYAVTGNKVEMYKYSQQHFQYIGVKCFESVVNQIHANKYGLWISYQNRKGGYLFDADSLQKLRYEISIPGFINNMTDDREGGMWLSTTDNGLFYIPNPQMVNHTLADGLASSVVYSLEPAGNKKIWVGYNTGQAELVSVSNGWLNIEKRLEVEAGKSNNSFVLDIVTNKNYGAFFLSRNKLMHYDRNTLHEIKASETYKSLFLLNDTILGIGGWVFCLYNIKNKTVDSQNVGRVYAQCSDASGNFWLGSINGLYVMKRGKGKPMRIKALQGFKINTLVSSGEYIWVGTQNNGLYLLRDDSIMAHINHKEDVRVLSNTIKSLAVHDDKLYVGTNRGIACIVFEYSNLRIKHLTIINHNDGLLSPEVNDIKLDDSTIYVATYGGFVVLSAPLHAYPLIYKLSSLSVKNLQTNKYIDIANITIPYSEKGIEIGYNMVALKYADEISYRYRLESFDNTWKFTSANTVLYTNIPPGKYTFVITAFDNRGNVSETIRLPVTIKPAIWQTSWFRIVIVLLFVLIMIVLFYLYYRYTKKRTNAKLAQGKLVAKAKLEALRAQLKPHFIFNSMNAISDYLHNNQNDDATELLQGFAGLIRKGLRIAANDFTTIAEEASFLLQYLKLEQKKCDKCFDFVFDVDEKYNYIVIPSLVTQPFVENAIVHGVRNIKRRKAMLHIAYVLCGNDLVCTITDNGVGIKKSLLHKQTDSLGTSISKNRIAYFKEGLGIDIQLSITDLAYVNADECGTRVVITIKNIHQFQTHENNAENTYNR